MPSNLSWFHHRRKVSMTDLKRLVLDYRSGELVVRCLYRTEGEAGPNTKARRREENRGGWLS